MQWVSDKWSLERALRLRLFRSSTIIMWTSTIIIILKMVVNRMAMALPTTSSLKGSKIWMNSSSRNIFFKSFKNYRNQPLFLKIVLSKPLPANLSLRILRVGLLINLGGFKLSNLLKTSIHMRKIIKLL